MRLNDYDAFKIVNEPMPFDEDVPTPPDVLPGRTLYRRIAPAGTPITLPIAASFPGFWSPQFHFLLQTVTLIDFGMYHHYSASHKLAAFTAFFVVTKLIPGTKGARRSLMFSEGGNGKRDKKEKLAEGNFEGRSRKAKVHATGGEDAKGSTAARDIIYVDMEIGAMREHLETEWGFKF